jgi:hypothetical protein
MTFRRIGACSIALLLTVALAPATAAKRKPKTAFQPHVVVATLDTGFNPFHPTWTRPGKKHPSKLIPGYPSDAPAIRLTKEATFSGSVLSSQDELAKLAQGDRFYWFPGTNVVGTWSHPEDQKPVFDDDATASHSHGAQASSQIAGLGYGTSPDAYIVIVDRTNDGGSTSTYRSNADALKWAADQPWIDVIHTNIQNPLPLANNQTPVFDGYPEAVEYALGKGKLVVSAGGNFWAEPTETSPHAGPSGVLVAGANDNCGYTDYSNPDPHVVMDGYETLSAHPTGFEDETFGGTSSASPRTTGYVAQLILELRREFGYAGGIQDGALIKLSPDQAPAEGPLKDGSLTAAELHEVVRKTANPNPHESKWDGEQVFGLCIPQPGDLPYAFYPKMGYGEVSEHTLPHALDIVLGRKPMPERPMEDAFYNASEELRKTFWP